MLLTSAQELFDEADQVELEDEVIEQETASHYWCIKA